MRSDSSDQTSSRIAPLLQLARDPLIHFIFIGVTIFITVRLFAPEAENAKRMVVDQSVYEELVDIFADTNERALNLAEMNRLVNRWVLNETLYCEEIALGLQDGDEMIRERTMQKSPVLIQNAVILDPPEITVLRDWFEERRKNYDTSARITFRFARVDGEEQEAWTIAAQLNAPETAQPEPGTVFRFNSRTRDALVNVFGDPIISSAPITGSVSDA